MPQNVTAGALNSIQARLDDMFAGDTPNKYPYKEPGFAAAALMERNTATVQTLRTEDGAVQGHQVHFLQPGSDTVTQDDTPATVTAALDCTVADPEYSTSGNKLYQNNKMIVSAVAANDGLAGNIWNDGGIPGNKDKAASIIAERIMKAMKDQRLRLDNWAGDFLHATRTGVNNDAEISGTPFTFNVTASANRFEAAAANFQNADFLTDIDALAANNNMDDYFMLSGRRNFYNAIVDATYRRNNDDERYLTRFDTADIYFDIRRLDSRMNTATGLTNQGFTFVVGSGTYAVWNYAEVKPVAVEIAADTWVFTVQDPYLSINTNGVLVPVTYEVLYKKECTGRDALGRLAYDHLMELRFLGGLVEAPPAEDAHTGILELATV